MGEGSTKLSDRISGLIDGHKYELNSMLEDAEALECKLRRLDVQLAEATPKAYCSRVVRKLFCVGDMTLLEEAMNCAPQAVAPIVHVMGEASTGRFVTLVDVTSRLQSNPEVSGAGALTVGQRGRKTNPQNALNELARKYGTYDLFISRVRIMEEECVKKELRLAAQSPDKMMTRIKRKLSWVGDLSLLRDTLDEAHIHARNARPPYGGSSEVCQSARQLVLMEVAESQVTRIVEEVEESTHVAKNEPLELKRKTNSAPSSPQTRKRYKRLQLNEDDAKSESSPEEVKETQEERKGPRTRSMSVTGFWHR